MKTKLRSSLVQRLSLLRIKVSAAMMAGSAFMILACAQAPAASWNRALNPQPLPPGIYAPGHSGLIRNREGARRTGPNRRCVEWGRVCVKTGMGSETHPARCVEYAYYCEKVGFFNR
jgi:hypothetical protein